MVSIVAFYSNDPGSNLVDDIFSVRKDENEFNLAGVGPSFIYKKHFRSMIKLSPRGNNLFPMQEFEPMNLLYLFAILPLT